MERNLKMKVIYTVPDLYTEGGIQEFAKSIYSELKDEFDMEIFDFKNTLNFFTKIFLRRFPVISVSSYLYTRYFSNNLRKGYNFKEKNLIHCWNLEEAMPFLDRKYIVSCHGMEILKNNLKGHLRDLYPKVLSNALLVHSNSNYTKEYLVKEFGVPEKKIVIIHPPIGFFKPLKIKHEKIIIGTLSRLVERKNIPNIIKSLNILREKENIDFIYYLAGDGTEKEKILKDLSRAKFEWKYFGLISEEKKMTEFYPSIDIFVMPPLDLHNSVEGFGIVYLEANSYGIPVVASKTGGVPEAVKENISGVFANPANPEDIEKKIIYLIKNKDKFYNSSINWVKNFNKRRISEKFAEVYYRINKMNEYK